MNENERMLRVIYGKQESSLDHIKRYSLCDCLTLFFKNTYTAMGCGTNVFNEKLHPGQKYVMPFANKLPDEKLRKLRPVAYKTPQTIESFLWSPFHDSTSWFYDLGDDIPHAFRFRGLLLDKYGCVEEKINRPQFPEIRKTITTMRDKVEEIWPDANKILIFYDYSRFHNKEAKQRMDHYRRISLDVLKDWHHLKVELTDEDAMGKEDSSEIRRWNGWEHYAPKTREILLNQIREIERSR